MKRVEHTRDTLPPLTTEQQEILKRLAAMPDDEINTSDIPEMTEAQLVKMQPAHYRPLKKQITARLDADVLVWLKTGGKGYQSRMNAILRQAMLNAMSLRATAEERRLVDHTRRTEDTQE